MLTGRDQDVGAGVETGARPEGAVDARERDEKAQGRRRQDAEPFRRLARQDVELGTDEATESQGEF